MIEKIDIVKIRLKPELTLIKKIRNKKFGSIQ